MSGSKVNDFSIGDSNIQSVMLTLDKTFKGLHQVSLTNYDNTSESQIAAGSVVECGGAQYKFDSNESITGSPSDGTVYIRLVPAGDNITAEYTNTAPTWSDSKQGWYGTSTDANKRYIEYVLYKDSSDYILKDSLTVGHKLGLNVNLFYKANGTQTLSGSSVNVLFQDKQYDIPGNGSYNPATGIFTVPQTGCYSLSHSISPHSTTITGRFLTVTSKGSSMCLNIPVSLPLRGQGFVFFLEKGDRVYCGSNLVSSSYTVDSNSYVKIKKIS